MFIVNVVVASVNAFSPTTAMAGNCHFIHPKKKRLINIMSAYLKNSKVAKVAEISEHTVQRTLATWRQTGQVTQWPLQEGRPRILTSLDVSHTESEDPAYAEPRWAKVLLFKARFR